MTSTQVGSPSEHSPTRVTDFDMGPYDDERDDDSGSKKNPLIHALQTPRIEIIPLHRRKQRNNLMPTLEERSMSSTGEESYEDDTNTVQLSNVSQSTRTTILQRQDVVAQANPDLSMNELKKLSTTASHLASRGKETQAIQRYHRALKLTRMGVKQAKRSLDGRQVDATGNPKLHQEYCDLTRTTAEICTNMAVLYERIGDYKSALATCREAHAVYQKMSKTNKKFLSQADQLSQMMCQLKKASMTFVNRKRLHQNAIHTRKLITVMKDAKKKMDLYGELFKTLKEALKMEQESLGERHPQIADTVGLLATAHVETKNIDAALEHLNGAVSILRLSLGPYHPKTGMGYKQLGSLYDSQRKNQSGREKALHFYGKAITSFRQAYGKHNALVGSTLNNMAVIYIQQKEYDRAVDTLNDALASYENVAINNNGEHPNTAQIWRNLGQVYSVRGEWESAILAYVSSLKVQRAHHVSLEATGATSRDILASDQGVADTLKKLGKAMSAVGRHEDALEMYAKALQIYQNAVSTINKSPAGGETTREQVLVAQEKVASTMQCMGGVEESRGNLDEAMLIYVSTLMLRRQNSSLGDQSQDGVQTALSMSGIGSVHLRKGEYEDAVSVLEESLNILKKNGLPDDHVAVVKSKQRLAEARRGIASSAQSNLARDTVQAVERVKADRTLSLDSKAQALVEEGDYDGAIRILTQVLVKRRQRLTRQQVHPSSTGVNMKEKDDVARTLGAFAAVLSKKGDFEQAQVLLLESLKLYKANGVDDEDHRVVSAQSELNRLSVCM